MTGYVWQRWLADEFRAAGLTVVETPNWKNRGRPASTGGFDPRGPATNHHTGTTTSAKSPRPTVGMLISGRSDLPGPLCHYSVGYDGVVTVIAAGRANHAGAVERAGALGMPLGADGNALAMGDEIDTNGTQAMPAAQRKAVAITNAVVLKHWNHEDELRFIHRHQDITPRKWDLGSLTTLQLRTDADAALDDLEDDMKEADFVRIQKMLDDTVKKAGESIVIDFKDGRPGRTLGGALRQIAKKVGIQVGS